MEEIPVSKLEFHYTCGVCRKEFRIPWVTEADHSKMIEVIEHEEHHKKEGEIPSWEVQVEIEEKFDGAMSG